jgi:hypothetical protein
METLAFKSAMGKKSRANRLWKLYKQREQRPLAALPGSLKRALAERGVDVPANANARTLYRSIGIRLDPNADARNLTGFRDRLAEVRRQARPVRVEPICDSTAFVEAAESLPRGAIYQKHLTEFQLKCIVQLRAFYGDDLEMMSVDHRRNPLQWSVPQLRRVMAIYEREAALLATKKDELEHSEREEE